MVAQVVETLGYLAVSYWKNEIKLRSEHEAYKKNLLIETNPAEKSDISRRS